MTSTELKAVASFNDAEWKPVKVPTQCDDDWTAYWVLWTWDRVDTVEGCGLELHDITQDIDWQRIDADTFAYRIAGKLFLVIAYEYDGAPDGKDWTITDWHMGPGGAR